MTPEQRAKEKAEHEKMMQHKEGGKGHGSGMLSPHGAMGTPHQGGASPMPPANTKTQ